MRHNTIYVLAILDNQNIYFTSPWSEEPEHAAYRFFKMHCLQLDNEDQTSNFFETNSDLSFGVDPSVTPEMSTQGRQYILSREGGLIAKFYNPSQLRWSTFYQGPWHLFVNHYGTSMDLLYGFNLSIEDRQKYFMTLLEARILVRQYRAELSEQKFWQEDADFLEFQLRVFSEREEAL